MYKTIASLNGDVKIYDGKLGYANLLKLTGEMPKNIEHIEVLHNDNDFGDFYSWSNKIVENNFGSNFKEGFPIVNFSKDGSEVEVITAYGELENGVSVLFDKDSLEWVVEFAEGGKIESEINKDNFYLNTICGWHIQNVGDKAWDKFNQLKKQDGIVFKKSPNAFGLYSQYLIDGDEVYRISDHWGYVGTCTWHLLNNQIPDWLWSRKPYVLAKANFTDFIKKEQVKNEFAEGGKIGSQDCGCNNTMGQGGEIEINKDNFYKQTEAFFEPIILNKRMFEIKDDWDKIKDKGEFHRSPSSTSQYVCTKEGVYRLANHWHIVFTASCYWQLKSGKGKEDFWSIGYCKFKDFKKLTDADIEYLIKIQKESRFEKGGSVSDHEETYKKWKSLVNMSKSELQNFYNSEEGKEAGLSSSKANELGIHSGRESARWIMKMKDKPNKDWTPKMWEWAKRQISFISRMSGNKGGLYDEKGNKTRKHTSLLIWGHNPKKYESGGSVSQTPAPKSDKVYGSKVNAKGSSKDTKIAKEIKFDAKTLLSINEKVREHNKQHPNKKITLASAKAVVRRGMGAYSSTHRPTISGGKPNSRVAWGLARLNAFMYKIINGKSKSGKYKQDDDLINELGYSVKSYEDGGMFNDKELLAKWKKGESIGFTAIAHLKAKGLIPRADGTKRKSEKYMDNGGLIEQLRAEEQAEYHNMSNPKDEIKRKEIYDKYDKLITPLMKQLAPNGKPSNLTPEQYMLVRTPQFKAWFGDWEKLAYAKINDSGIDEITLENLSKDVSKIVDENGEPLVCYHGTDSDFNVFKGNSNLYMSYFTDNKTVALSYSQGLYKKTSNSKVLEVFLNIKNPLIFDTNGRTFRISINKDFGHSIGFIDDDIYSITPNGKDYYAHINNLDEAFKEKNKKSTNIAYNNVLPNIKNNDGFIALKMIDAGSEVAKNVVSNTYAVENSNQVKLSDGSNTTFDANNPDIRYARGGMIEVVLNEGNGVVINNLFNQWNSIKNEKDFDKWAENVRETKFGTYGTVGLLEVLDRFNFNNSQKVNSIQKDNFIKEVKSVLNNYAKGGEVSDWDFEFTGGNNKGQKFSQQQIETIDVYDDNIYSLLFVNGSVFDAKTSETIGLLSITDNVVKLAVILGDNVRSDQKIIRRLQKLAEDSDRVIVENNSQLRSEKRLYPFLLVSKNDATNYTIAEQFQGKLDTPKKALSKKLVQDAIDSGSFLKQIKEGRDVKGVIEIIKSNGLNVPIEILEYENKEYAKGSLFKPHKTIEQIAKEKNVSLQHANEQLEKGMKIESEHSNSLDVQKTIALQHLDEMIDYYQKLEIMEQPKDIDKYYGSIKRSYSNGGEVDSIYTFPTPTGAYTMLQYVQQVLVRTTEFKKYFGDWELAAKNFLADKRTNFEKHYKNVSKVINLITLEPLVVYHGSSAMKEFFEFDAMAKNQEGRPYAYFADNIQYSQNFVPSISQRLLRGDAKALLYKAFIKINNPFFALGSEFEQIRKNKDGWILTLTQKIYADKEGIVMDEAVFNDYLKATKSQLEKYFEDTFANRDFLFWNIMSKDFNKTFKTFLIVNGYDGVRYSEEFDPTNYDENNPAQFTKAWTIFDASQVKLADGRNINFDPMNKDIRFEEGGNIKETDIVVDVQPQSRASELRNKIGLKMDAGGFLLGKKDGKLIAHNDGDLGGIFVGKRHSEGGIDGINKATGEPIEVECEEIQLNSKAVSDSQVKKFEGKEMTNREILSHLNVAGGGKSFKMGGEIEHALEKGAAVKNAGKGNPIEYSGGEVILTRGAVSSDKKYEYNGKMMTTREIASEMNVENGGVSFKAGGNIPQKTHNFVSDTLEKSNDAIDYVNDFINRVYG